MVQVQNQNRNCQKVGIRTGTCQKSEPEPELVKSRNQIRKNSYGSALLHLAVSVSAFIWKFLAVSYFLRVRMRILP
jgi:hypothetical protein